MTKMRFLSGNTLKLLAAVLMVVDHVGFFLYPNVSVLRCIGRLSLPIFAFMIAEGAKYTRNKLNYLLGIATLAFFCQIGIYLFDGGNMYMTILVTFSLSIPLIYALQYFKKMLFEGDAKGAIIAGWLFVFGMILAYFITKDYTVDYDFFGVMAPVTASIFDFKDLRVPKFLQKLDNNAVRVLTMGIWFLIFAIYDGPDQYYALLSIPILLLYSEKRGKLKMKYFFYVFYPLHIVIIQAIGLFI